MSHKKPKLTSLRFLINKKDKGHVEYFKNIVEIDKSIDYKDLYYQLGNK